MASSSATVGANSSASGSAVGGKRTADDGGDAPQKRQNRTKPEEIKLKLADETKRSEVFYTMVNDFLIGEWMDPSDDSRAVFLRSERVTCKYCGTRKQFVNISDVRSHGDGQTHKDKRVAHVKAQQEKAERAAALNVTVAAKSGVNPHEVAVRARALSHGRLVSLGCNANLASAILSSDVMETLSFANIFASGAGKSDRMRNDAIDCAEIGKKRIRALLQQDARFFSLIIDGASSKLMGGHHINAILIWCPELRKPILLRMAVARNGSGKALDIAETIRDVAAEYDLNLGNNCVGLMADNASVNNKVSKLLGFKWQLRCIAHTYALVVNAAIDAVPGVKTFLTALHNIFTAGGNTSRRNEAKEKVYVDAGMDIHAVSQLYLNRWGTASTLISALVRHKGAMLKKALPLFFEKASSIADFRAAVAKARRQAAKQIGVIDLDSDSENDTFDGMYEEELHDDAAQLLLLEGAGEDSSSSSSSSSSSTSTSVSDSDSVSTGEEAAGELVYSSEEAGLSPAGMSSTAAAGGGSSSSAAPAKKESLGNILKIASHARKAAVGSAALRFVDESLNDEDMYAKLLLVESLTEQFSSIATAASSDNSVFSASVAEDVLCGRGSLKACTDDAASFWEPVVDELGPNFPQASAAALAGYAATAVAQMRKKYVHVEAWANTLHLKLLWDHRTLHDKDTLLCGQKLKDAAGVILRDKDGKAIPDPRVSAGWFGMDKMPTNAFLGQWNDFVAEVKAGLSPSELALEPAVYWRRKASGEKPKYLLLYKVALWYAAVPLSSVAAERAIGLMREIEMPKRNRLKEESWQAENFIRYNKWVIDDEFERVRKDVRSVELAVRSKEAVMAAVAAAGGSDGGGAGGRREGGGAASSNGAARF